MTGLDALILSTILIVMMAVSAWMGILYQQQRDFKRINELEAALIEADKLLANIETAKELLRKIRADKETVVVNHFKRPDDFTN